MTVNAIWLQDASHPASLDRHHVANGLGSVGRTLWGLAASAGPGAMQVTVSPGQGLLMDYAGSGQGVLVTNDAPLVVDVPAVPGPFQIGWYFDVGSEEVRDLGSSDALPGDLLLAHVAVTPSTTTITPGMVTDARVVAPASMTSYGSGPPTHRAPAGAVYVETV